MKSRILSHVGELASLTDRWNDLWEHSDSNLPTVRAEHVLNFVRQFAGQENLHILVAEDQGQLVAALPLIMNRRWRSVKIASLPVNPWSVSGDLLIHHQANQRQVCDLLVDELRRAPAPITSFDWIEPGSSRWTTFLESLSLRKMRFELSRKFSVGTFSIDDDWEQWQKQHLTGSFRKSIRRRIRQLSQLGNLEFSRLSHQGYDALRDELQRFAEIEHRGWKGAAGSSMISTPGIFEYYTRQAEMLHGSDMLQMMKLELDGRLIAFDFGYQANRTYYSYKIGYDPEFAKYSPGQVLTWFLGQSMATDRFAEKVDTVGPLTAATSRWTTDQYRRGRLLVSNNSFVGDRVIDFYRKVVPTLRQIRNSARPQSRKLDEKPVSHSS